MANNIRPRKHTQYYSSGSVSGNAQLHDCSTLATTLSKEIPSALGTSGLMNQSADEMDIDISVDPRESLPINGTQQISTKGATDIDINNFPPRGVTIAIENETVYGTSRPVIIG